MNEKSIIKQMGVAATLVFLLFLLLRLVTGIVTGNDYTEVIDLGRLEADYTAQELEVTIENPGKLKVVDVKVDNNTIQVRFSGKWPGSTTAFLRDKSRDDVLFQGRYQVMPTGSVTNMESGNYSSYRIHEALLTALMIGLALILWKGYADLHKHVVYSYYAIFTLGCGTWVTILAVLMTLMYFRNTDMVNVYAEIQKISMYLVAVTFPLILVCGVLLAVADATLIHEDGVSKNKVIGILLAATMVFGAVILFLLTRLADGINSVFGDILEVLCQILWAFYALGECFLLGAMANGILAAFNSPSLDKDFIMILGGSFKRGGILSPAVKARADKALELYNRQMHITGKKAFLVPSGGKSGREAMSKAEAIRRYLVSKGVEQERILIENRSQNIQESMGYTKSLIEQRRKDARVAFAATNYQVFRNGVVSRQMNFHPEGIGSFAMWYYWPNAFLRETVDTLLYSGKVVIGILAVIVLFFVTVQVRFQM